MATISEIYDNYAKLVYFTAYGICHSGEVAWDVLQTVFVRVLEHERTVARLKEGQLRSWLFKTARNATLDIVKRNGKERPAAGPVLEAQAAPYKEQPEEACMDRYEGEALNKALEALPQLYRAPLTLFYCAELSGKEAAKMLGINESTLRSRILRGKSMLQEILLAEEGLNG